jgi:hypothetical protein
MSLVGCFVFNDTSLSTSHGSNYTPSKGRNATCAIASTKAANLSEAGTAFASKRRLFGSHKC